MNPVDELATFHRRQAESIREGIATGRLDPGWQKWLTEAEQKAAIWEKRQQESVR